MKRERWGSLLVQEKYQEEMPVTRDDNNNKKKKKKKRKKKKEEKGEGMCRPPDVFGSPSLRST